MAKVRINTCTTIYNTLYVDASLIEGITDDDIARMLQEDPEYFGRDDQPYIEPDMLISVERDI